jgi:hypothetical protein
MALKKLYIFVEGIDDVLFFNAIIIPFFLKFYADVEIIQYAQLKRIKVNKYLESIATLGFDYLLISDLDEEPSIKQKKNIIKERFCEVDFSKIIVVIKEIESWFIAGLSSELAEKWGIENFERTELVTKEDFNLLYGNKRTGKKFKSRLDFMQELLKYFDIEIAIKKNISLEFFYSDFLTKSNKLTKSIQKKAIKS